MKFFNEQLKLLALRTKIVTLYKILWTTEHDSRHFPHGINVQNSKVYLLIQYSHK